MGRVGAADGMTAGASSHENHPSLPPSLPPLKSLSEARSHLRSFVRWSPAAEDLFKWASEVEKFCQFDLFCAEEPN